MSSFPIAAGGYWLPPDYSKHGPAIDAIFMGVFWLTMAVFVIVEVLIVYFMIKYRRRGERGKAFFTHGHTRLEMIWTLVPAAIFLLLAMWSKQVWDNFRYSPAASDPRLYHIMVIGEQFKWNVIYPGPDGKLGRYLLYPKPTDLSWPKLPSDVSYNFPNVPGPAYLPEDKALAEITKYVQQVNPLGKDFDDPDGEDDLWQDALAHPLELPKDRPVEITLGSKDVIHDMFLPNFRVKLDAVPGLAGKLYLTATRSSTEFEKQTHRMYSLDEVIKLASSGRQLQVVINEKTPEANKDRSGYRYKKAGRRGATIIRDGGLITWDNDPENPGKKIAQSIAEQLKEINVTQIEAFEPKYWDMVCEQLCGAQHYTMANKVTVLEPEEFAKKYPETPRTGAGGLALRTN